MDRTITSADRRLADMGDRALTQGAARSGGSSTAKSHLSRTPSSAGGDSFLRSVGSSAAIIKLGPPDPRSLLGALLGAALYFPLAYLSISLSRFDTALATVWLPSAVAVAFLLRAKLANELAFYAAAFPASVFANTLNANPFDVSLVFSLANLTNVALVTGLTRRLCGASPDMSDLVALGRFVAIGGMVGPLAAASIAALAMAPGFIAPPSPSGADTWTPVWEGAVSWFLTDSMGMLLVVPTALLIGDALTKARVPQLSTLAECAALLASSLLCLVLVFSQNAYPLLFLIMPMTLVHAFRLGSTGTALHIALVAAVSTAMTWAGYGPVVETSASPAIRLQLIQAFIAANFLTGLPIAAILAGRDRLTEALTDGRRELALLANSITDAVLKLDARGVCTYASPSVSDVLGRDPSDFVGKPIQQLTHEDASQRIADVLGRLLRGESEKERLTYRRRCDDEDGVPVFIEADCAVTLDPVDGQKEGVVISARDVTERVELELLLTRARRHAENAASAKSDFLANMSHEIRTPMNGVLGFAELMLQGELDPEQRRHTEMIVDSGRSMMLLLNDILDLSKIEAGQIVIDTGPIDLHATLDECVALHRQTAKKKGLSLSLEYEMDRAVDGGDESGVGANPLPTVITDGLRLRQIVLNLLGNAVKFTESGEIRITYWAGSDQLCVRVHDTGIGISPNRLDTIFQPFTQGEGDTARRFGGTGLGLSISRQLADRLGGTIAVQSERGVGSTFTLSLPTTLISTEDAAPRFSEPFIPDDLPQHARILLAEDHDVNRMLVTEMLERCGQSVDIAQDGGEAISMVIDSTLRGRPYDLVLMDVQMPDCDGYAATRAIREEGIGPDSLPIIALTANAFPEDVVAAREAGMQAHLAKPVVFADLARALQRWLPTRIVETPMDRDMALAMPQEDAQDESGAANDTDGPDESDPTVIPLASGDATGALAHAAGAAPLPDEDIQARGTRAPSLLQKWLNRREEAVEAVRAGLAAGLIGRMDKRRAEDQADRADLIRLIHKLAGTAGTFGEPELGEQAAVLEQAMKTDEPPETCEAHAFALLALADEPTQAVSQGGSANS
ncbi:MAG: ATP-binding protein [Pseudomonadota bacterium]